VPRALSAGDGQWVGVPSFLWVTGWVMIASFRGEYADARWIGERVPGARYAVDMNVLSWAVI